MNAISLKKRIMLRVYVLFVIRKLKSPVVFETSIFVISLLLLSSMVSLHHIVANTPHNLSGFCRFWLSAFTNTGLTVKAIVLVTIFIIGLMVKDAMRYAYISTNRLTSKLFVHA